MQCRKELTYSESVHRALAVVGARRPQRCEECERILMRELRTVPMPSCRLRRARTTDTGIHPDLTLAHAPLGRVPIVSRPHRIEQRESRLDPAKFGVKQHELENLYRALARPDVPAVVAVAPTGSGKSTYLPFRLLVPFELDWFAPDTFTRNGLIVVTQPRIAPTREIPGYVANDLHGADLGKGQDIGFRYSGNARCDWRNRMVYVTDGTLINWLATGQVDRLGLVMIDEAHERSTNIDIILGMLVRLLPLHPHLKVVIASATIDAEKFRRYFDDNLPGDLHCEIVNLSGKVGFDVQKHFRDPALEPLPYTKELSKDLNNEMARHVAEEIVRLLKGMVPGASGPGPIQPGDIVGFLHGSRAIDEAVALVKAEIEPLPALRDTTDVLPLYRDVKQEIQDRAIKKKPKQFGLLLAAPEEGLDGLPSVGKQLVAVARVNGALHVRIFGRDGARLVDCGEPGLPGTAAKLADLKKLLESFWPPHRLTPEQTDEVLEAVVGVACTGEPDGFTRRRVILSSNMAETSLTIDGIIHVVESGIIKESRHDPLTGRSNLVPVTHSQSGCRQRWGRAGRQAAGHAWCLYTEAQFQQEDLFARDTTPSLLRSPLDQVVLNARRAGADRLDGGAFPWLDAPESDQIHQAEQRLRAKGAIDAAGDLTAAGLTMLTASGDPVVARLIEAADRFGCAVEMATLVAFVQTGLETVMPNDRGWPEADRRRVHAAHDALRLGCRDDMELVLKLHARWTAARDGGPAVTSSPFWQEYWSPPRMPAALVKNLPTRRRRHLKDAVKRLAHRDDIARLDDGSARRNRGFRDWLDALDTAFRRAAARTWARSHALDAAALALADRTRTRLIDELGIKKKDKNIRVLDFAVLDRLRLLCAWCLPDQVYATSLIPQDVDAGPGAGPAVRHPRPDKENDDGTSSGDDRPKGDSDTEGDPGATDEPTRPGDFRPWNTCDAAQDHRAEIGRMSAAFGRPIEAFVTWGTKIRRNEPGGTMPRVIVPFVIEVPAQKLPAVQGRTTMEMVGILSRDFPKANAERAEAARLRLLIDHLAPLGSIVRCRVVEVSPDGSARAMTLDVQAGTSIDLDLLHLPAIAGKARDEDATDLADQRGGRDTGRPEPVPPPESETPIADMDPDLDPEDTEGDTTAPGAPTDSATVANAGTGPVPGTGTTEAARQGDAMRLELPARLIGAADLDARASTGEPIVAEVVGYRIRLDDEATPELLLAPPRAERIARFAERFVVGEPVPVVTERVIDRFAGRHGLCFDGPTIEVLAVPRPALLPRQDSPALIVREPMSQLEIAVPFPELGLLDHWHVLEGLPPGSALEPQLAAVDPARVAVELTALPGVLAALDRLAADSSAPVKARVRDVGDRSIYVHLEPDPPVPGLVLPAQLSMRRGEPGAGGGNDGVPSWRPGQTLSVRINFPGRVSYSERDRSLRDEMEALRPSCAPYGVLRDGDGWVTAGRMSLDTRAALLKIAGASRFREAVLGLFSRSNLPYARPFATDLDERFPAGTDVTGVVTRVTPSELILRLDQGVRGILPNDELTWLDARARPEEFAQQGQMLIARVCSTDMEAQAVNLSLKDRAPNPWPELIPSLYPRGRMFDGVVHRVIDAGVLVELEPGLIGFVRGSHVADGGPPAPGARVRVRVLSVNGETRRIALSLRDQRDDPWLEYIPRTYKSGDIVAGKVQKIEPTAALVEIERNVVGRVYITEFAHRFVRNIADEVHVGKSVRAKVVNIDAGRRRFDLSIKQAVGAPAAPLAGPKPRVPLRQALAQPDAVSAAATPEPTAAEVPTPALPPAPAAPPSPPRAVTAWPVPTKQPRRRPDARAAVTAAAVLAGTLWLLRHRPEEASPPTPPPPVPAPIVLRRETGSVKGPLRVGRPGYFTCTVPNAPGVRIERIEYRVRGEETWLTVPTYGMVAVPKRPGPLVLEARAVSGDGLTSDVTTATFEVEAGPDRATTVVAETAPASHPSLAPAPLKINQPPAIAIDRVEPDPPIPGEVFRVHVAGSDPEGQPVRLQYNDHSGWHDLPPNGTLYYQARPPKVVVRLRAVDAGSLVREVYRTWDIPRARELSLIRIGCGLYGQLQMSADGRRLAASTERYGVALWDLPTSRSVSLELPGLAPGSKPALQGMSDDGSRLLCLLDDRAVVLDTSPGKAAGAVPGIRRVAPRPSTFPAGGRVRVIELPSHPYLSRVSMGALAPDGATAVIASGSAEMQTVVHRSVDRPAEAMLVGDLAQINQHTPYGVSLSRDNLVLTIEPPGTPTLWDGRLGTRLKTGETIAITGNWFDLARDGTVFAQTLEGGMVLLWTHARPGPAERLRAYTSVVSCLSLSRDGRRMVTTGSDKPDGTTVILRYWDVTNRSLLAEVPNVPGPVTSLVLAPDAPRAVCLGGDKNLHWFAFATP